MKVTIKAKADTQERITLRVPAALKKRMDETRTMADSIGADYYGSIVDVIAAADQELRQKLIRAGAKSGDETGDRSGDRISTSNGASHAENRADK